MTSSPLHRIQHAAGQRIYRIVGRWLARRGYSLARSGKGYIDAKSTIQNASRAGVSICEYLDSQQTDERKRGRRDRIIQQIQAAGCLSDVRHVTEIGTGTGMYLEQVVPLARPDRYEVYETSEDWRRFLDEFVQNYQTKFAIHDADGNSLCETTDQVSDLVHAHGVFVYLSTIDTFKYLTEMARVCRPGGYVVFDCYFDTSFDLQTTQNWIDSGWRFPVLTPQRLAEEFYAELKLVVVDRFKEVHGASSVDYEILRKTKDS